MSNRVKNPYAVFTDIDGKPLDGGYVYIGEQGLNPISNPISVFWDSALTIPAANIRTIGGYLSYNGSPGTIYASDLYSILVKNKNGVTVFSSISLPADIFTDLIASGYVEVGGMVTISEDRILMDTADINYVWSTSVGGYLAIGTNGRVLDSSEANMVLNADKSVRCQYILHVNDRLNINGKAYFYDDVQVSGDASADCVLTECITERTVGEGVSIQAEGAGQLRTKVIEIGDWNMDSNASVDVLHGITAYGITAIGKIRSIDVLIINDDSTSLFNLVFGGYSYASGDHITLNRTSAGVFDSTEYDSTSYNRGWVTIVYEI